MADDKTNRGPRDRSRININEDYEVRYWTEKFRCTSEELHAAVGVVGVSSHAVERLLRHRK